MTDIDIEAEVQRRIAARRDEAVAQLDERAREQGLSDAMRLLKKGIKAEAFLESGLGRMFLQECARQVADACEIWMTEDDPAQVATALNNARGARMALHIFSTILADAADGQRQLQHLDQEVGSTDE